MEALTSGQRITTQQIRTIAKTAVHTMEETDGYESSRQIGDRVLASIAENGSSSVERIVAAVARQSVANVSARTAVEGQKLALQVLGGGVSGPLTVALATLACKAMDKGANYAESRSIGSHYLHGISENADEARVLVLGRTAEQATAAVGEPKAGIRCERTALEAMRDGLRHETVRTLKEFGQGAMKVPRDQDSYNIGKVVLQAIYDNATDPSVQFVAKSGADAANASKTFSDATRVQRRTLKDLR